MVTVVVLAGAACSSAGGGAQQGGTGGKGTGGASTGGHGGAIAGSGGSSAGATGGASAAGSGGASAGGASAGGASAGAQGQSAGGAAATAGAGGAGGAGGAAQSCPLLGDHVDIPATMVSGTLTLGGTSPNAGVPSGTVSLKGALNDRVFLGSAPGPYALLVVPGTYDVVYEVFNDNPVAPSNTLTTLQRGIVVGTTPLSLDVTIPATKVTVSGFTVNGSARTESFSDRLGGLSLVNAAGDNAVLTATAATKGVYATLVIPGTYDLVYRGENATIAGEPLNTAGLIQSGIIVGSAPVDLKAAIVATKVSVAFTFGGVTPANALGVLSLRREGGDVAALTGDLTTGTYSGMVLAGTYDLHYQGSGIKDGRGNAASKIRSGIVVGSAPVTLTVDYAGTMVSSRVTVNEQPFINTFDSAAVYLQSAAGEIFRLPEDGSAIAVVPGTYDVLYSQTAPLAGTPANRYAKLRSGVVVGSAPLSLDIDVPSTALAGNVTVNGAGTVSGRATTGGAVFFREAGGSTARIASLIGGSYAASVIPGTYDIYYSQTDNGQDPVGIPLNSAGVFKRGVVIGASAATISLDLDVPAVSVDVASTINGVVIASDAPGRGFLELNDTHGDKARFAAVAGMPKNTPALIVPGTYGLYFGRYNDGPTLPANGYGYVGCFTVR